MFREATLHIALLGVAWLLLTGAARAEADLEAGRAVVVGGTESTVTPCFMCHGLDGVGDSAGAFPRLTAQAAFYMYKQLIDYASGTRPNDVMGPIAKEMTEPQMADVAYYYSELSAPFTPRPQVEPDVIERGRKIAQDGRPQSDLQACNLCHGRGGSGNPPAFPYLAGQYAPYTELQLQLWKQGIRQNDALDVMADIAMAMSDDDIHAVALYFEWLRPNGDAENGAKVGARQHDRSGG
jgi:cytochrome c553